jgi:hypothetical protein
MTVSGEVRYRPEGFRIRPSATRESTIDNYFLQRYLLGAGVHFNQRARVFLEVQSSVINGSLRSPRPTDRNTLDLHQGFFEWRQTVRKDHRFSAKVGRQELAIGSSRLISASPGLNAKRAFDGAGLFYRTPAWTFAGAAARLVALEGGTFDDRSRPDQQFWGVAAGYRSSRFLRGEVAGYYLGIDRDLSLYAQGTGPELRHTAGLHWGGGIGTRVAQNYDVLLQWGRFGDASIHAWAFATETSYLLSPRGWRPRVSLRVDVASGDRDLSDPQLDTFNPLFPGNSYSGNVGLLGPSNLTDLTPGLTMRPLPTLTLGFEAPSYWRTSTRDGVYGTDLRLLLPPTVGDTKYVGTNPGVIAVWQATRHTQLQGAITRFLPGAFLDATFLAPGFGFYSCSFVYRF